MNDNMEHTCGYIRVPEINWNSFIIFKILDTSGGSWS